ncbi:MAG: hypothetical protein MUO87_06060 [Thermoplasmata archaeon]|nr:hypothetical protein [Thermoplasmata archaeon]
MVFAPQWRTDGLVRIEMMIIDMTGFKDVEEGDPRLIDEGTIDLTDDYADDYPRDEYPQYWAWNSVTLEWYWSQQLFLLDDSSNLDFTSMVSVSYICVTITEVLEEIPANYVPYSETFEAGWLPEADERHDAYDRVIFSDLGREVNKHGGLIYGMLWDTAADPDDPTLPAAPAGEYRVDVQLGKVVYDGEEYVGDVGAWYTVDFAVGHLYVSDGELLDPVHPYVSLVPNEGEDRTIVTGQDENGEDVVVYLYDDLGVGLGWISIGTEYNTASILLGQLIGTGSGGGNGDGDSGGNGQGNCGDKAR